MMKIPRFATLFFAIAATGAADAAETRDRSFDSGWRFLRADAPGAEAPGFSDAAWWTLDLPHDWSIEDLPPLKRSEVPEFPVTAVQAADGDPMGLDTLTDETPPRSTGRPSPLCAASPVPPARPSSLSRTTTA